MNSLKAWLNDFPSHGASSAVACLLILLTGCCVVVKLALGQTFPDGYGDWLILLGALAGVSTVGMVGKRLSSIDYKSAGKPPQVTIETAGTVTATTQAEPAQPLPASHEHGGEEG